MVIESGVLTGLNKGAFYDCNALKEVNYKGTSAQWNKIKIGKKNDSLLKANRNYI